MVFAIASMFGFESTAIYSAEAKDPARTVPRATYLAVAVVATFFAFVSWMVVSAYGPSQIADEAGKALASGDSTSLLFSAMSDALGGWAGTAAGILMATSLLAGILAFHNACNRYKHSLGHGGGLPMGITRTNRFDAPWVASAVQTATAVVLVVPFAVLGLDPILTLFSWGSGVAVVGLVVLYFLTSVSVVAFFRRTGADTRPWQTLIAPILSALLIAALGALVLANFDLLIGGSAATAIPLILSVPVGAGHRRALREGGTPGAGGRPGERRSPRGPLAAVARPGDRPGRADRPAPGLTAPRRSRRDQCRPLTTPTSSSSAQDSPGSPRPGSCSARDTGSSSWRPGTASAVAPGPTTDWGATWRWAAPGCTGSSRTRGPS